MELVETARAEGLPVVRSTIQTFGAKARDAAVAKAKTDEDRAKYEGFTASINWAKNFIVRNNLSKTMPHGIGDGGSVDATLGRQESPQEAGVRNGTDEGGPGDGGQPAPDEDGTVDGDHPAPEGEEEEEQKNAFGEGDPKQPVADHADGSTSRPDADTNKAERGAGRGAKKAPVPPPYADVADYFGRLEATAGECAMERVSHFLRLAKMEWIDEFEKRKGRQTDIRDFFSSK